MQTFQSVYISSQQDLTRDRTSWLKTTTALNPLRHNMEKHVYVGSIRFRHEYSVQILW